MNQLSKQQFTTCNCQVLNPQIKSSAQGNAYQAFQISNGEQRYIAHAWEGQYKGPRKLMDGQNVHIRGRWVNFKGYKILRCYSISPTEIEPTAIQKARTRIRILLLRLSSVSLRQFVSKVFEDERLLKDFITLPASVGYHHGYPGGLFVHSVNTAWRVSRNPELRYLEKDIAITAALLHDIGKVRSYTESGQLTDYGKFVDHDANTLVILNQALCWLDTQDISLGLQLRHHLSWNSKKPYIQPQVGAMCVRFADQMSTASEIQRVRSH